MHGIMWTLVTSSLLRVGVTSDGQSTDLVTDVVVANKSSIPFVVNKDVEICSND